MRLQFDFIKKILSDCVITGNLVGEHITFSIDTRTLQAGDIFVALIGARTDGHDFVAQAIAQQAAGVIIATNRQDCLHAIPADVRAKLCVIVAPDTKKALLDIARAWRQLFTKPVIGVTGSVGKTTTKELLAAILRADGKNVLVTIGNQNTLLGIALTLVQIRSDHEAAIIEMGISRPGEMKKLAELARPTVAIITTIGHSHMEGLGSLADIAAEKRAIFAYFKEDNIGIINGDISFLTQVSYQHPMVKFGQKTTNQVQARKVSVHEASIEFVLKVYGVKTPVELMGVHEGRITNILAATAAAHVLQVPLTTILAAIKTPVLVPGRFEPRQMKFVPGMVINDCYNASPESMKAALTAFEHMVSSSPKVAVLGDMLELGPNTPFWHRQLGRFIRKVPSLKTVVLVGSHVVWTKKTLPVGIVVEHVADWQEALAVVKTVLKSHKDPLVLVKGSRSIGLDQVVDALT